MVTDLITKTEKLVVAEGQEPPAFWAALGGKAPYASSKRYPLPSVPGTLPEPPTVQPRKTPQGAAVGRIFYGYGVTAIPPGSVQPGVGPGCRGRGLE